MRTPGIRSIRIIPPEKPFFWAAFLCLREKILYDIINAWTKIWGVHFNSKPARAGSTPARSSFSPIHTMLWSSPERGTMWVNSFCCILNSGTVPGRSGALKKRAVFVCMNQIRHDIITKCSEHNKYTHCSCLECEDGLILTDKAVFVFYQRFE